MKIQLIHRYSDIISLENFLEAWKEFVRGKRNRKDIQEFSLSLMDNILSLQEDLLNHTYNHGPYQAFNISDPKPRNIHKAEVGDRLLHHAIYRILYPLFDKTFISDSYSCRINKGTHKALGRFRDFSYVVSKNNTKTCWILKCDIKKFFANIDHEILIKILKEHIPDKDIIWLLEKVIGSFNTPPFSHPFSVSPSGGGRGFGNVGLPLGNLTSQLLVNIYMNHFDQFVKHKLKVKYYIRYADDFVIFSEDKAMLEKQLTAIGDFLQEKLKLELHPDKVFIKTLSSGVDFLGWVNFPDHRILRTTTKRRMFKRVREKTGRETVDSYLGMLKWGNTEKLKSRICDIMTL